MRKHLDKLGSAGALIAAAACPICFPKLALLGSLIGLGAFSAYEAQLFIAAQLLVIVAVVGQALAYRQHRKAWLLGGALVSGAAVFAGLYFLKSEWLTYAGFAGLVAASGVDLWSRLQRRTAHTSVITCPKCGERRRETMPTDACQFFYECRGCGAVLRPLLGDCCVFCSYGTVKCPPKRAAVREARVS
jgi:hypothetical protein